MDGGYDEAKIRGGEVGRNELMAAKCSGKNVRFIPANMDHHKAHGKAQDRGLPVPTNSGGAAGEVFDHQ